MRSTTLQLRFLLALLLGVHCAYGSKVCNTWIDIDWIPRSYYLICGSHKFSNVYSLCGNQGGDLAIFNSMDDIYDVSDGLGFTATGEFAWVGIWFDDNEWIWDDDVSSASRGIDVTPLEPYYEGYEAGLVGWQNPEIEARDFTDSGNILCSKDNPNYNPDAGGEATFTLNCNEWISPAGLAYDYFLVCGSHQYYDGYDLCSDEGGEIALFDTQAAVATIADAVGLTDSGEKAWVGIFYDGSQWRFEDGVTAESRGVSVEELSGFWPGDEAYIQGSSTPSIKGGEYSDNGNILCSKTRSDGTGGSTTTTEEEGEEETGGQTGSNPDPVCGSWQSFDGISNDYYLICGSFTYNDGYDKCSKEGGEHAIFEDAAHIATVSDSLNFSGTGQQAWVGLYNDGSNWRWEDGVLSSTRGISVTPLRSNYDGDEATLVGWTTPEIEGADYTEKANILCSRQSG